MKPILLLASAILAITAEPIKTSPKSNQLGPFSSVIKMDKEGKEVVVREKRQTGAMVLPLDGGFAAWDFGIGNAGEIAKDYFTFQLNGPALLSISDCFCGGDRFIAHLREVNGAQAPIDIYANEGCDQANGSCNIYSENPTKCFSQAGWCKGKPTVIPSGSWELKFEILTSPFLGGTAYALLQSLCPTFDFTSLGLCCLINNFPCYYSPCIFPPTY